MTCRHLATGARVSISKRQSLQIDLRHLEHGSALRSFHCQQHWHQPMTMSAVRSATWVCGKRSMGGAPICAVAWVSGVGDRSPSSAEAVSRGDIVEDGVAMRKLCACVLPSTVPRLSPCNSCCCQFPPWFSCPLGALDAGAEESPGDGGVAWHVDGSVSSSCP